MPIDRLPQLDPVIVFVAALVNPVGGEDEGRESVTLLNRTDSDIALNGWAMTPSISSLAADDPSDQGMHHSLHDQS